MSIRLQDMQRSDEEIHHDSAAEDFPAGHGHGPQGHNYSDHSDTHHGHDHHGQSEAILGHSHLSHADTAHKLAVALGLTFVILGAELIGGIKSHSLALLSDAAHMVTDVAALGLAWYAQMQALRPPTQKRTYGFHRAGIMAAMANAILLVVMSVLIAWEAIIRLRTPESVSAPIMMGVAALALVVNLGIAKLLNHGHGSGSNLNVKSALLHVIGDAAAAAAVIVGGLIIAWQPHWTIVDPLLSLGIAVVIVFGARQILRETFNVLMEGTPTGLESDEVERSLASVPGVREVHHLHIWTLSPGMNALSGHVVIEDQALSQCEEILTRIDAMLRTRYNVDHSTIQFEHRQCSTECCISQEVTASARCP